ncbi:hypothetical protein GCM10018963_35560 [Saccharothrix longispora]
MRTERSRQDAQFGHALVDKVRQVLELLAHHFGTPDAGTQHVFFHDEVDGGRVLASEPFLPRHAGLNQALDVGRAQR